MERETRARIVLIAGIVLGGRLQPAVSCLCLVSQPCHTVLHLPRIYALHFSLAPQPGSCPRQAGVRLGHSTRSAADSTNSQNSSHILYLVHTLLFGSSVMASVMSFRDANRSVVAGVINGPVSTTFHVPPGKTPARGSTICASVQASANSRPTERPETSPQPSAVIPFRRDPDFVERGTLLDEIRKKCSAPASRVALVGLGGVGCVEMMAGVLLATNAGTESRSSPSSTAIASKRHRWRRGCSGCTQARRRGSRKGIVGLPKRRR